MPEKPSNADDHELSQDQAQEMERLASSQIDVYSKIEGIKLRTNQEVNALDEQLHQLQAQVQELIEKQREAILEETELQRAILALQDQRQTAEEEVGKTQLLIQTLDSEKAATIAGLPERMAPLQRTIEHVQEQLQAVHRLSPSLTSQQGDHPPSTFVPLPDPDELTFGPEFAKHFLKTEDLKSLHIAVEPLCNLVHAYVSLPPASRDVFSDRNTCTASVQWALTRSPDKRRHREPEDSDDESAVPTTPHMFQSGPVQLEILCVWPTESD
jgi:hypothetical protein